MTQLQRLLDSLPEDQKLLIVDGLFSMGDVAPLPEIVPM